MRNPPFAAHQKLPEGTDPNDPSSYKQYTGDDYAPDRYGEQALEFIEDDELVEITPKAIRIRKRHLKEHERKRASKDK